MYNRGSALETLPLAELVALFAAQVGSVSNRLVDSFVGYHKQNHQDRYDDADEWDQDRIQATAPCWVDVSGSRMHVPPPKRPRVSEDEEDLAWSDALRNFDGTTRELNVATTRPKSCSFALARAFWRYAARISVCASALLHLPYFPLVLSSVGALTSRRTHRWQIPPYRRRSS